MTREEWKAWAMSLKPGDKVIVKVGYTLEIANVESITENGKIKTNLGDFALGLFGMYTGCGKTYGCLYPANQELIAEAERQEREEQERRRKASVISEAKSLAYMLRYGEIDMPYEMAEELIALVKKYKGDKQNG